jgi:hypothetical protein
MASWADTQPIQFAKYKGFDVDLYGKILLAKQDQYDKGIAQVQSMVDQTATLPVMGDDRQAYLKQKTDALAAQLSGRVGADWGSRQLIAEAGGLAAQVAKDPVIQNAVISATNIKEQNNRLKKAQEDGKSSAANELDYMKGINAYLKGGLNASYNGQFHEYVDCDKIANDAISELTPGGISTQTAVTVDKDGQYTVVPGALKEMSAKGVPPERIQSTLDSLNKDPRFANQMRMNAQYQYQGVTAEQLQQQATENFYASHAEISRQIDALKLSQATTKNADSAKVASDIKALEDAGNKLLSSRSEIMTALSTPEGVEAAKTKLYTNQFTLDKIKSRSYADQSTKYVNNPMDEFAMKQKEFALKEQDQQFDQWYKTQTLDVSREELKIKAAKEQREAGGGDVFAGPTLLDPTRNENAYTTFVNETQQIQTQLNQTQSEMVNQLAGETNMINPYRYDDKNQLVPNIDPAGVTGYKNLDEAKKAAQTVLISAQNGMASGNPTPKVANYMSRLMKLQDDVDSRNDILRKQGVTQQSIAKATQPASNWEYFKQGFMHPIDAFRGQTPDLPGAIDDETMAKLNEKFRPYVVGKGTQEYTFMTPKPEDLRIRRQQFMAISSAIESGQLKGLTMAKNPKFAGALGNEDNPVINYAVKKRTDNMWDMIVTQKNGERQTLTVTPEVISSIPGVTVSDPFQEEHGARLSMTGGLTTDISRDGQSKGGYTRSYQIQGKANSRYAVSYHLNGPTADQHEFKLYIRDLQQGGQFLANGLTYSVYPGGYMNDSQIMTMCEALKNDGTVEQILKANNLLK